MKSKLTILAALLSVIPASGQTIQKFQKGVQVADRSYWTETLGGKEPIWGVNAVASTSVDNRVNANHTDGFSFIHPSYIEGLRFYATESGASVGAQINLPANRRLWLDGSESVVWGPWTGEVYPQHTINYRTTLLNGTIIKALGHNMATSTTAGTLGPGNFEGACYVVHGPDYAGTLRYANSFQVYAFAGMESMVIGNNAFTGNLVSSGPLTGAEEPNGNVRIELGPKSPESEKAIWTNDGTFLMGRTVARTHTASQSGTTTVTGTVGTFQAGDDNDRTYLSWAGKNSSVDLITGFTNGTTITTERARTRASQTAEVVDYKVQIRQDGNIYGQEVEAVTSITTPSILIGLLGAGNAALSQTGSDLNVGAGFGKAIVPGLIIANSTTPASAAAAGVTGTVTWDADFIYVCIATNTWKRVAISTW